MGNGSLHCAVQLACANLVCDWVHSSRFGLEALGDEWRVSYVLAKSRRRHISAEGWSRPWKSAFDSTRMTRLGRCDVHVIGTDILNWYQVMS